MTHASARASISLVALALAACAAPEDTCTYVGPEVAALVAEETATGWGARNAASGMVMFGCEGASGPRECLADFPLASTIPEGAGWNAIGGVQMRLLHTSSAVVDATIHGSPDGRFVGRSGSKGASYVIDLARDVERFVRAYEEPRFFPDGSGFVTVRADERSVCPQDLLTTDEPGSIVLDGPDCTTTTERIDGALARSLEGDVRWSVVSSRSWRSDPLPRVGETSELSFVALTPGDPFLVVDEITDVASPWEGNAVLALSARMLVTQRVDDAGPSFVLHRLEVSGDAPRTVTRTEVARYCVPGRLAQPSYDGRWLVTSDAASDGTTNAFLIDVTTGERTQITRVAPGQSARSAFFRSDGWIYVYVQAEGESFVVATDAAIVLAGG
jgi:hypothetical protein